MVKGDYGLLEAEIRQACNEALRYCSVGVHVRDAGQEQFPTISPREEDLLRRSALQQSGVIGLDLTWWSAKRLVAISKNRSDSTNPWTKVLMGRYLLDGGRGASRPKFFKLMDGFDAKSVIDSARYVEQKLTHIKLACHITAKNCALIVTEKVGAQDARPRSLETIFAESEPGRAREVALQIADQVQQLGDLLSESKPLKALLWSGHDIALVTEQWNRFAPQVREQLGYDADPISLFSELLVSDEKQRITERSLVHGDLHMSNVALDLEPNGAHAYIFDAGVRQTQRRRPRPLRSSRRQSFSINGLSMRTSSGSARSYTDRQHPEQRMSPRNPLLGSPKNSSSSSRRSGKPPIHGMISKIYALMVFDFVLIQVGGLAFGSYGNRIVDRPSAAYLLAVVAEWYRRARNANPI